MIGMIGVIPLATWLYAIGRLSAARWFDNEDASTVTLGKWLAAAGAVAAVGALTSLVGLAARRRGPAAIGAIAVVLSAFVLLAGWEWSGWRLGNDDSDLVAALVAVVCTGSAALRAASLGLRTREARR